MPSSVWVGGSRMSTIAMSGACCPDLQQQLVGVVALRDHVEAGVVEQPGEALAQQHAVLGDRYAHGISARTRVPPPRRCSRPAAGRRAPRPGRPARAGPSPRSVSAPPTPVVDDLDHDLRRRRGRRRRVADVALGMLADVGQALARPRSRPPPRPARAAARRVAPSARPGTGARAASDSSATARPWPLSTAG